MSDPEELTATWREEESAPRHFDAALQVVRYKPKASSAKSTKPRTTDPEERQNLIKGLANPLLYHRHSHCLSQLHDAILSLETARKVFRDANLTDDWREFVTLAIKCAERAWEAFINPLAWMNQRRYVEAGDTGGMWKEDKRCKLAVEYKLLELEKAKERCISAIHQMCWTNERGWSSPERALLGMMAYNGGLAKLTEFEILFTTIDKSLKSAIDRVVKNVVAKGVKMHEPRKREDCKKGERMDSAASQNL
ncbi:hypothetical protein QFC21_004021 [Naganishia friedmannii]|uniref:Uncharacterized protein n=1 Tax=Naganishia friedmannii TaxID=89922 RepID=A0ACC2VIM6_9TREE|nr:hypothetical protein QFC21_004021 [Naganishia friedmannii]